MKSKESLSSDIRNASLLQYIINISAGIRGSRINTLNKEGFFLHNTIIASIVYTADVWLYLYYVIDQPNFIYLQIYIASHYCHARINKAADAIIIGFKMLSKQITIAYMVLGFLSNNSAAEVFTRNCSSINEASGFTYSVLYRLFDGYFPTDI
jgi:hypothetical protein